MDSVVIRIYQQMREIKKCTVDNIICDPELRNEFVSSTVSLLGSNTRECDVLKRLLNLRKASKL